MAQKDLIPMSERSKDEVKEIGRKGGINSGKTRRAKRDFKQKLAAAMELMTDIEMKGLKNEDSRALMKETGFMGYQLVNLMKSKQDNVKLGALKEGITILGLGEPEKMMLERETIYVDNETQDRVEDHIEGVIGKKIPKRKKKV